MKILKRILVLGKIVRLVCVCKQLTSGDVHPDDESFAMVNPRDDILFA